MFVLFYSLYLLFSHLFFQELVAGSKSSVIILQEIVPDIAQSIGLVRGTVTAIALHIEFGKLCCVGDSAILEQREDQHEFKNGLRKPSHIFNFERDGGAK